MKGSVMNISDILAKDGVKDNIGAEGVKLLENAVTKADLDAAIAKAVRESDGKATGLLNDKKKLKAELDELKESLEELKSADLSELDKIKRNLEKSEKAKADLQARLKASEDAQRAESRSNQVSKVVSQLRFLDGVPASSARTLVEAAVADIEDLSDESAVTSALDAFRTEHKALLAADSAPAGSGSHKSSAEAVVVGGKKITAEAIANMPIDEFRKHRKEITAAAYEENAS